MSNKYSSKLDSFIATNLYNLPMPVLPPADLALLTTVCVPSYLFLNPGTSSFLAGFLPTDNAYFRALGFNSNLADGLVPNWVAGGAGTGWEIKFQAEAYAAGITGITNTPGTDQMTGGTGRFTQFLDVNMTIMWLDDNKAVRTGVITAIAANGNSLTLSAIPSSAAATMLAGASTGVTIHPFIKNAGDSKTIPFLTMNTMQPVSFFAWTASLFTIPSGTVSVTVGLTALTGIGTKFTTDYAVGDPIGYLDDTGTRRTGKVLVITSDTAITLLNAALATVTNQSLINLQSAIFIKTNLQKTFNAYTITIDPLFGNGTRRLALNVMAEIEYTFALPVAAGTL